MLTANVGGWGRAVPPPQVHRGTQEARVRRPPRTLVMYIFWFLRLLLSRILSVRKQGLTRLQLCDKQRLHKLKRGTRNLHGLWTESHWQV